MSARSNGRLVDQLDKSFCGPRFESCVKQSFFSNIFFLGDIFAFQISKCLGSAVVKFVLMINTYLVNRVKYLGDLGMNLHSILVKVFWNLTVSFNKSQSAQEILNP